MILTNWEIHKLMALCLHKIDKLQEEKEFLNKLGEEDNKVLKIQYLIDEYSMIKGKLEVMKNVITKKKKTDDLQDKQRG